MHDESHSRPNEVENDNRCFSCGEWGWRDEVDQITDRKRSAHVCVDCLGEISEAIGFEPPNETPVGLTPEQFNAFLNDGCSASGAFHLCDRPQDAGFEATTFEGYFKHDLGYWQHHEKTDSLGFCCLTQEQFLNMLRDIVKGDQI